MQHYTPVSNHPTEQHDQHGGAAGSFAAEGCAWCAVMDRAWSQPAPVSRETALRVAPLGLREANALVQQWHRHHKPARGHRFSIGVVDAAGVWHGAIIVGRPVARLGAPPDRVLEVTRLVTDGTPNACSMLYGAAARAGRALGYERIQTFTLMTEPGTSLRAAGWLDEGRRRGRQWIHTQGAPRRTDQPTGDKRRWSLALNAPRVSA